MFQSLDYRILTAGNNESALGEKCLRSFLQSPQHASVRNKTEPSGFNYRHIDGPMRTPDSYRSMTTSDFFSDGFGQQFDTVVRMSEIGRQDKVVALPYDQARIQTIIVGRSSAKYSLMAIDQSAVASIRTKKPRKHKGRQYMVHHQQRLLADKRSQPCNSVSQCARGPTAR